MRTINSTIAANLAAGRTIIHGLIRFELASGNYGFARAAQPIVYGGLTYYPGGAFQVSDIAMAPGTAAQQFTISLAMSADDPSVPAVLKSIYNEDYRDRPVYILDAYSNPDTGALIDVITVRRGYIDVLSEKGNTDSGPVLIAECLTRALDYSRRNGRYATNEDQQRRSSGDLFYSHASKTGRVDLPWGREKAS